MNLKQLHYFCEVVEAGNARIAAEKLFIAPTAISMQVGQLENLLGGLLFDRATRPMTLTALGQYVYPKARELLASAHRLEIESKGFATGKLGWLSIGFTRSSIFSILPEAVRAMHGKSPDVRIELVEILTEDQPASLRSGAIHLGIARTLGTFVQEPDLEYTELFEDPLVAALPIGHPLTNKKLLLATDLEALPFISFPKFANSQYARQVLAVLRDAGARIEVGHEAKEIHTAIGLVAAGLGSTIVGQSVALNSRADIRFVPIADIHARSQVFVVRKADRAHPLTDTFIETLLEQVFK
jgi:LysR family transcriptional regulator, benzoate and cis,cis-muconate-responsive activator of ben and cat genes